MSHVKAFLTSQPPFDSGSDTATISPARRKAPIAAPITRCINVDCTMTSSFEIRTFLHCFFQRHRVSCYGGKAAETRYEVSGRRSPHDSYNDAHTLPLLLSEYTLEAGLGGKIRRLLFNYLIFLPVEQTCSLLRNVERPNSKSRSLSMVDVVLLLNNHAAWGIGWMLGESCWCLGVIFRRGTIHSMRNLLPGPSHR